MSEGPGPWWAQAEPGCVGVRASASASAGACACASVRWRAGWTSRRSPVRESSRSRWPTSRCGSDSAAYPLPHRSTLDNSREGGGGREG